MRNLIKDHVTDDKLSAMSDTTREWEDPYTVPGRLYILCGMPGSGKSEFAKNMDLGRVISTDIIREELSGDINNMDINDRVFYLFHKRIRGVLETGRPVVADSTALTASARYDLLTVAGFTMSEVHLIVFNNPTQAFTRNKYRERSVPDSVMFKMLEKLEKTLEEIPFEFYKSVTYIESVTS